MRMLYQFAMPEPWKHERHGASGPGGWPAPPPAWPGGAMPP